ncbi:MAG: hypothetical protein K1W30_01160 [Lachnospiraceae bacterium]
METLKVLVDIVIVLAVLAVGLGILLFPIWFDTYIKNKTGKGFLNYWLTGIELICLIGCFNPTDDTFEGNLGCLLIAVVISAVIAWKKAKKFQLEKSMAIRAVSAQILSPVSILFILFMIESVISSLKKNTKDK